MTGKITSLDPRGFGFIAGDDSIRYFFHASRVRHDFDQLTVGQRVQFGLRRDFKGIRATDVQPLKEAA